MLEVNRTSIYYTPSKPDRERETVIKSRIDFWHTKPYMGVRKIRTQLQEQDGLCVGRKLIKRYMDEMGIYVVYPKPKLLKPTMPIKSGLLTLLILQWVEVICI